jgi:hypothetical protein
MQLVKPGSFAGSKHMRQPASHSSPELTPPRCCCLSLLQPLSLEELARRRQQQKEEESKVRPSRALGLQEGVLYSGQQQQRGVLPGAETAPRLMGVPASLGRIAQHGGMPEGKVGIVYLQHSCFNPKPEHPRLDTKGKVQKGASAEPCCCSPILPSHSSAAPLAVQTSHLPCLRGRPAACFQRRVPEHCPACSSRRSTTACLFVCSWMLPATSPQRPLADPL